LSPGATINPPANEAQNFFTPQGVTYTVTAEDSVTTKTYIAKATINAIASGVTGDCIWTITGAAGNYTLTISGNGAMADYVFFDDIGWWYDSENDPLYQWRSDIKTIVIHDGVTSIGDYAFFGCRITSISIPNSVTSIGDYAFSRCSGLTSITIGNSVTSIGEWAFSDCSSLTSITIPNSVTSIGERTFYGCIGLTSITVGSSVTSIGSYAFYGCSSLIEITNLNSVPQSIDYSYYFFYGINKSACTLRVPSGSVDAYKAAAGWSDFENITGI
jgi:hypothetical protein